MLYLHCLSLNTKQPLSLPQLSLITNNKPTSLISVWLAHLDRGYLFNKRNTYRPFSLSSSCIVYAVDKDSQQYEIDKDKAKEALQKLDQQLQELSKKQVSSPKIRASEVKVGDRTEEEEANVPEISGSFLVFVTAALFLFTIVYNIIFITVIDSSTR
ncbi:hypothetical protein JCGZ_25931 [Jatropha curcas]|uniref:Uncharacterized protein n=1 Tax=Jatropha curcas TaxID=180498 RepID=A0A067JQ30_JATCU|nr:hypothetical protein JCGZ_25931 [Jatropha curcas]